VPHLLAKSPSEGLHTFSNATEGLGWMEHNCFRCWHYEHEEPAGELCTFEMAAMVSLVSAPMMRHFGWVEDAEYPDCYEPPDTCAQLSPRPERNDDDNDGPAPERPTPPDPRQLVLIADPTEDAAQIVHAPEPVGVSA